MGTLEEKEREGERDRWGLRSGASGVACLGRRRRRLLLPSALRRRRGEMPPFGPDQRFRPFVRSIRKYFAKVQSNKVIGERERRRRRGGADFSSSLPRRRRPRSVWFGLREKSGDIGAVRPDIDIRPSSSMSSSTDDTDNITITEAKGEAQTSMKNGSSYTN